MPTHDADVALATHRDSFLTTGSTAADVRTDILESWRRSLACSVHPDAFAPLYRPDVNPEGRLLRAAEPVLRHLTSSSGDLGLAFLVTDDEARILARWTDSPAMIRLLDKVSADEGHVFSEDAIGTNGLGTAVELGRTVRIDGREHFADILGDFTCVGVPIRDPLGRKLIGVLDITCVADHDNKLITMLATQTAEKIERSLYEQQSPREQALLQHFLAARRSTAGIVVLSERLMLADPRAGRLIEGFGHPLLWEWAGRALTASGPVEQNLPLGDESVLATSMNAIREGSEVIGVLLQVRQSEASQVARARSLPAAAELPPGLVGQSPALRAAFRACRDGVLRDVVVISGEHGVGKVALARAVHRSVGQGEPVERDCAEIEEQGLLAWFDDLRVAISGDAGTLILRHLHRLAVSERLTVADLLRGARERGWRVLGTILQGPQATTGFLDAVDISLAPLRERDEDVPALAGLFAGQRRLTPEVVQLLTRLLWLGNIPELRRTVSRMIEQAPRSAPVRLADVPPDITAAASRRPLSRFERAEISAILTALADCGGNKTDAAALVGISRSTLYRKLRAGGVDLDNTAF